MTALPLEEQVKFLLSCLRHNDGTPEFTAVAQECGITNRKNARCKYKAIVENQPSYLLNAENQIILLPGITPQTTTVVPAKRGRPKKNPANENETERPSKKPRKPRAKKAKKIEVAEDAEDAEEEIKEEVDDSNIGEGEGEGEDEDTNEE